MKIRAIFRILGSILLLFIFGYCLMIGWVVCQCRWGWGLSNNHSDPHRFSPETAIEVPEGWFSEFPSVTVSNLNINILPEEKAIFFGVFVAQQLAPEHCLWDVLSRVGNIEDFEAISTAHWQTNYSKLSSILVHEAHAQGLNAYSLRRCINSTYDPQDAVARLPVAAFSVFYNKRKAWVVCYVWEYAGGVGPEGSTLDLSHVSAYLFDEESNEIIELVSCG